MTIWSDQKNELTFLKSLYEKTTDDNNSWLVNYYSSEKEAKEAINKKLRTKIPLTGTTWVIHKDLHENQEISDNDKTFTISFISGTQVKLDEGKAEVLNRAEMPADFPACMQNETCTVGDFLEPIKYCKSNDDNENSEKRLSWEHCPDGKKFTVKWLYKEGKMTAEHYYKDYDNLAYKDLWVKQ